MVVNYAIKTASRREKTVSYSGDGQIVARLADPGSGPEDVAEQAETQRRVWAALAELPSAQRAAAVQRYYLGMSEKEMAEVRPAPSVELDQKVEVNGVEMTLDRVVNSPARPQAVICFQPPDDRHEWYPLVETQPADREAIENLPLGDGCWSVPLYDRTEGRSSVTVTSLDGFPTDETATGPEMMQPKILTGPWKFAFELPER